jgi:Carbohydrate-selective porin, OprB family
MEFTTAVSRMGVRLGLSAVPDFSGYYFQIGEIGASWLLGTNKLPGSMGLGGWDQTGQLTAGSGTQAIAQNGTEGFYTFVAQRLWLRHPGVDNSGVSGFFQFGINDSSTMLASKYFGLGLTGFGLVPHRPSDSIGVGAAWSWLNRLPGSGFRSNELILAAYYQAHVFGGVFMQPTLSYIPNPGASRNVCGCDPLSLEAVSAASGDIFGRLLLSAEHPPRMADWFSGAIEPMPHNVEMTLFLISAPADLAGHCASDNGKVCMITATVFADTKQEAMDTLSILERCPHESLRKTVAEPATFESLFALSGSMWPEFHRNKVESL